MFRSMFFIILVLGMSMCSVSRAALLQDNFDGDTVDLSKWQLINGPDVSITQANGQVFFNRPTKQLNYLATVKQFNPAVAPLTIIGSVTLATNGDMDVWTRANIIANTGGGQVHVLDSGIRINFWQDAVDAGFPPNLDILEKTAGIWPYDSSISEDDENIPGDDEALDWDFVITDNGTKITATFTQTGDPSNTLKVTGTSTTHFATNYVAFTVVNGYLNDVTIIPQGRGLELAAAVKPVDKATDVPRDVVLGWKSGQYADKHNVYFGTSFEDVNAATPTNHPNVQVNLNQDTNTYKPVELLEFEKTYYWRIDEVNAPPTSTVYPGDIWSFTTELFAYPIKNIIATRSSQQSETMGPEKTVDGSGLNDNDQHSVSGDDMWLSAQYESGEAWIQYEFDKVYKLHEMWVWNYNQQVEPFVGFGLKNVTIQYSTDEINWPQLSDVPDFNQATGMSDYTHNTTVSFNDVAAKYVKLTVHSNWGVYKQYGLSEVRFLQIPVHAREPNPTDGQPDVALNAVLSWRAGREADQHKLYISTSEQAVRKGTITPISIPVSGSYASYGPLSLELDTTYYWKVDEVNGPDIWKGDVWSFTTRNYFVVDDMESYGDAKTPGPPPPVGSKIWYTWKDGEGWTKPSPVEGNGSGSVVDLGTNVHGGNQSLAIYYDSDGTNYFNHSGKDYYSEVRADRSHLPIGVDWTRADVKSLTLWFYGNLNNDANATEQMYVKLNGVKVNYDGDMRDIRQASWHEWNIDLAAFGIDLTNVTEIAIGFGDENNTTPGGSGMIYFDDIRLYQVRCLPSLAKPQYDLSGNCIVDYDDIVMLGERWLDSDLIVTPVDPGSANLVAHWKLDDGSGTTAADSSANGNNGTLQGDPQWVAGWIGSALELDGTDDYVDCGSDAIFDITAAITLSVWVNTNDAGNNQHNPYVAKGDTSYAIKHFNANSIEFFIYDGDWYSARFAVDSLFFNGEWHHLAGTYDGSELKLYVDGLLQTTTDHTGSIAINTFAVNIGRNSEATNRFYEGLIDDVRIYDRALSLAEVTGLAGYTSPFSIAEDLHQDGTIDLKDYALLADCWLEEILWPQQ